MGNTGTRPQNDAASETNPPVDRAPVGTPKLQAESQDLLRSGSGSGSGSGPRSDVSSIFQTGINAAALALQSPEVQAMLAHVIIGGLPTVKTTDGSSGPKNPPDSSGGLVRGGEILTDTSGPKVIRDDGRGAVRTEPIRRPHDLPPNNPGSGEGGVLTGHTVKMPNGDVGSLNKPKKETGSGEGTDATLKDLKDTLIKNYRKVSEAITGVARDIVTHLPNDDAIRSQVEKITKQGADEEPAAGDAPPAVDDPLADGILDFDEALELFQEADQAEAAERMEKVEKLLDRIPDGPVKDLMREASSQLLGAGELDTEKIQRMLKDAKEALGNNAFWNQMGTVMTEFSPQFSEQFGVGLTLNRTENENGDMQDAILVSQRSDNGPDNRKVTILAVPETGAPQVTQLASGRGGSREQHLDVDPGMLFTDFHSAAIEYYFEHQ